MELVKNLFRSEDLRKRIGVLLLCLLIYKIGMHIPVPGINRSILESMSQGQGALSLVNSFSGGALYSFSIFAVGIMPYITASIVIQLLQMDIVPTLVEWKNQGEMGRKKIKKFTYVATFILAIVQSIGMSFGFNKMYPGLIINESVWMYLLIAAVLTLGTVILVVMGEFIDRKGIGKGISMIILAGILMSLPNSFAMYYDLEFTNVGDGLFIVIIKTVLLVLFACTLLLAVIIMNGAERRVPVQSTRGGEFGKMSTQKSFLPIKINAAGVIPVIFASSFIMVPMTIAQINSGSSISLFINNYISYTSVTGMIIYALFIIGFTYFYAFVQMDPEVIAKNLSSNNSFVPTIRPGKETVNYLKNILKRLTVVGSIFLALVAILPMILGKIVVLPQELMFGGTSLIIIVSVVVDLKSQISSKLETKKYRGFVK